MDKVFAIKCSGGSMRPTIKSGDALLIERARKKFRQGDVILYESANRKFVHRIWALKICRYQASRIECLVVGDDGAVISPLEISPEQVVGKCIGLLNGLPGLIWGRFWNMIFRIGRTIKHILK